jgi:hypothetical protein
MIRTKESLAEFLDTEEFYPYVEIEEEGDVVWHVFGDYHHNFLWIVLTNTKSGEQAVEVVPSPCPEPMKLRSSGLDPRDALVVQEHGQDMWTRNKDKMK